ncbi:unnamed protein product [Lota lota]
MPFCKRTILPKDVCRRGDSASASFVDLVDVCGFTLCSVLRQLSDLSRHSVRILEELEGELVAVCRRSGALEGKVVSLQRHVAALVSKPPPKTASGLEADGSSGGASRRAGASSNSCHGNSGGGGGAASSSSSHGSAGPAHSGSPWQQSVNVFGSWSRPECVEELHQQAQQNLQSLLQDFEEQLYDCRLTGQTFRHPSSQDTPPPLCPSPVTLDDRRPDFIFLPASKQLYDDETASSVFGLRGVSDPSPSQSPSPSPCGSDRPPLGWGSHSNSSHANAAAVPAPPVADKPRWFSGRRATPGHHIPLDITGEDKGGRFLGVDLLQCSPSPGALAGLQPYSLEPRSLEPVSDTPHQTLPLRKTHSDLDTSLAADSSLDASPCGLQVPGTMDHSGLLCSTNPSPSWNGPKGSTFSPSTWNEAYSYSVNKGPAVPPKQHSIVGNAHAKGPGSHCSSFTPDPSGGWKGAGHHPAAGVAAATGMTMGRRSETEGAAASPTGEAAAAAAGDGGRGRERSARSIAAANAFKFRERSLSTPNDAGAAPFCLPDPNAPGTRVAASNGGTGMAADHHFHPQNHGHQSYQQRHHFQGLGDSYALLYPSASSEDSGSTADSVSVAASDYSGEGRLRLRSRSISLKKSKRKPPPPVRSVSLMKNLGEAEGPVHHQHNLGRLYRDGRPKSLHIPREHFPDFQQDFLLAGSRHSSKPSLGDGELDHRGGNGPPSLEIQGPDKQGEPELNFPGHWQLGDWKSDPYRSLSGSSTATGTTVVECMKVRGSSESLLDSPSVSRDASPSQFSMETDAKASSPFRPPGLIMSPSSGYSSQSETPTPTVPTNHGTPAGPMGTLGCKMRPKIPERKSSLPSPKDPMARSRLSFEMPVSAHLDLSAIRPKQKASRRHSDTSTAAKPGKMGPGTTQAPPVVTQSELKTVRLRSVSRGDLDDCPDGASDTIEEEQYGRDPDDPGPPPPPPPPPTAPKPKPPVAVKPPLPKRPVNLLFKSPPPASPSPLAPESPPGSPVERPVPLGNIYKVMRKPKPRKLSPQTPVPAPPEATQQHHVPHDLPCLPLSQSLFDLPPLPDPQPLIEDPGMEPESDPDTGLRVGPEDGGSLPSPCSSSEVPELRDKSNTLPSRMSVSCLAELSEKKNMKAKVPPPVPKKPSVLLLQATVQPAANGSVDSRPPAPTQADGPVGPRSPAGAPFPEDLPSSPSPFGDEVEEHTSPANERTELHITEETDDGVLAHTPTTHTTEDLFTIIHRSKRKVLGRKEPTDSFGSRQNLVSPVKHAAAAAASADVRSMTLGSSQRSSSRNENFMALLQKKGSKASSGGARVSAMELLKSTNPLARRVTEFSSSPTSDGAGDTAQEAMPGNGQ